MGKNLANKLQERTRKIGRNIRDYAILGTALTLASIGFVGCSFPVSSPIPPKTPTNNAPYVSPIPNDEVDENSRSYSKQIPASDVDGNTLAYSLTKPDYLCVDSNGLVKLIDGKTIPEVSSSTPIAVEGSVSDGTVSVPWNYTSTIRDVPVVNPPVNHAPEASLEMDSTLGNAPLVRNIKITGTDTDVGDYITSYEGEIDYNQDGTPDEIIPTSTTLINISKTFDSSADIFGWVTDSHGVRSSKVKGTVNVIPLLPDYLDISGQIKNNKTELGQKGKVKIFDSKDEKNYIAEVDTDNEGYFVYHSTTEKISDLSGVSIKGVLVDANGNPISYANTMRYPAGDVTGAIIKPHPDPTFASREDYREHRRRTNIRTQIRPEDGGEAGLLKWDLEGKVASENALKGIIIFSNSNGSFTTGSGSQREILEAKIKNTNDIEVAIRGSNLPDTNLTDGDNFPDLDNLIYDSNSNIGYYLINNSIIQPHPGYILVIPDNTLDSNIIGSTSLGYYQNYLSGIMNRVIIRINPNIGNGDLFKRVVSHEFKHALNALYDLPTLNQIGEPGYPDYDSQTLSNSLTILRYDTPNTTLGQGEADIEDAYINNEEVYSPRKKLLDIFGDF